MTCEQFKAMRGANKNPSVTEYAAVFKAHGRVSGVPPICDRKRQKSEPGRVPGYFADG
jgi:hypothetical protein